MKKRSKRYKKLLEEFDKKRSYQLDEAIVILKRFNTTKFDQSVEIAIKLGIDPRKTEQTIRGSVSLPKGIGKSRKVIVFADGEEGRVAKEAGADEVGGEELVKKIQGGWVDFDVAIAIPRMMKFVGKLGKILGPMGKMPSPKSGTVTEDVETVVKEFKAGRIEYRTDSGGNVHGIVGKLSFPEEDLRENILTFIDHIKHSRPSAVKGQFITGVVLSSTMGPGVRLAGVI
jgi:large subunit ribosomal protein L1